MLTGAMKLFGWLNLLQGILNVSYYSWMPMAPFELAMSGILAAATWLLVYMKLYFMMHTKSWLEVSLTAICGLYIPIIVLVFAHSQFVIAL